MSNKRAPRRSMEEWLDLVTECRQSGLTDAEWCHEHGISPSCFYNAVTRLRKRACRVPDPIGKANTLDLTSHKQDVVQIAIEPEISPPEVIPDNGNTTMYLATKIKLVAKNGTLTTNVFNNYESITIKLLWYQKLYRHTVYVIAKACTCYKQEFH